MDRYILNPFEFCAPSLFLFVHSNSPLIRVDSTVCFIFCDFLIASLSFFICISFRFDRFESLFSMVINIHFGYVGEESDSRQTK